MLIGLFADVDRRPVRNDVCALEQSLAFQGRRASRQVPGSLLQDGFGRSPGA